MAIDPKVLNLFKFVVTKGGFVVALLYGYKKFSGETDPIRFIGCVALCVAAWRILLSMYRRLVLPPKDPKSYGKWAIVTGTTSGIGKAFADDLAEKGLSDCMRICAYMS